MITNICNIEHQTYLPVFENKIRQSLPNALMKIISQYIKIYSSATTYMLKSKASLVVSEHNNVRIQEVVKDRRTSKLE